MADLDVLIGSYTLKEAYPKINANEAALNADVERLDATDASLQSQITQEQQDRIAADNAHASSTTAHDAANITYSGTVVGATTVKGAIDTEKARVDNIVASAGTSNTEIVDARTGSDGTAHAVLKNRLDTMEQRQLDAAKQTAVLKHGLQVVTVTQPAPLELTGVPVNVLSTTKYLAIYGQTLVNLLGKDGNFEKDSNADGVADGWTLSVTASITASLSTSNVGYGSKAQKILSQLASKPTALYRSNIPLTPGRYYVALVDVVTDGATTASLLALWNDGVTSSQTTASSAKKTHYVKFSPTSGTYGQINLNHDGQVQNGWTQFDGADLYDVDLALYNRVGVDITESNIRDYLPHVDGIQHVTNPMIQVVADNLIKPFSQWDSIHANAEILSPYELRTVATATHQGSSCKVDAVPNQTYTISVSGTESASTDSYIRYINNDDSFGAIVYFNGSKTFTTPSGTKGILIVLQNNATGTFTFTNPMLVLGSVAPTEFKPYNEQYLYGVADSKGNPLKLAGDDKTGVRDLLYQVGNEWRKLKRWETDVVLDGSLLAWSLSADYTGFKKVLATGINGILSNSSSNPNAHYVIKYNGLILGKYSSPNEAADTSAIATTVIGINVSDADTGWLDGWVPNSFSEEQWAILITAYFNGWKLCASDGSAYVSGAWNWKSVIDGSLAPTQTSTYVTANKAPDYTPYKVTYQLANETSEVVNVEGSLMLGNGGNHVTVGEAVIVRERTTPQANSTYYYIGYVSGTNYLTKHASKFKAVYKNGAIDDKWIFVDDTLGGQRARIDATNFDPTAEYTVTYIALDKYSMSANVTEVYGGYETTLKAVQDEMLNDITDLRRDVSVNVWSIAELYRRVVALGG